MRNKTKLASMVLAVVLSVGSIAGSSSSITVNAMDNEPTATPTATPTASPTASPAATKKPSEDKYSNVGEYYVAKGQPAIFKESKKGKIKIISAAGNKYKISGKKIKITCKKSGEIKYQVNGKKKSFTVWVNTATKKKEYKLSKFTWKGKTYKNYIDALKNDKNLQVTFTAKSKKEASKYNKGVTIGTSLIKLNKKYYDWDDIGESGNDFWRNDARYYDKKSGLVVLKQFYINKKDKVKKIVWLAYNPKKSVYVYKLR